MTDNIHKPVSRHVSHSIDRRSRSMLVAAAMLLACLCGVAQADESTNPFGWAELPEGFGHIIPKDQEPTNLAEQIFGGKVSMNTRLRWEYVEQDGRRDANAFTGRIRLGYTSQDISGFSFTAELEAVGTADRDGYFVPATGQGDPTRAVVADPEGVELNQGFVQYKNADIGITARVGRQRVNLDDQRFVGAVGWRQFEQTLDAASVNADFGIEGFSAFYAYVFGVQTIFSDDGPDIDSDSHLINVSYQIMPELKVVGFAYLLDFRDTGAAKNNTNSFGFSVLGKFSLGSGDEEAESSSMAGMALHYSFTYAHQTDTGANPVDYDADFFAGDLKLAFQGGFFVGAGFQYLGSDDGMAAFQFPLGTNHKFNGWADVFLMTPNAGLQDFYVYTGGKLPWGIAALGAFHYYLSDEGDVDFGWELNGTLAKKLNRNWSVRLKAAYYEGDDAFPDRTKVWLETIYSF